MIFVVLLISGGVLGLSMMLDVPLVLLRSSQTCGLARKENSSQKCDIWQKGNKDRRLVLTENFSPKSAKKDIRFIGCIIWLDTFTKAL
jgi:hypothetical protein